MLNKNNFTCLDSEKNELNIYEKVHFINEDNKIETGTIFALLRENEILVETSVKGKYVFKNGTDVAKVFVSEKEVITNEKPKKKLKETISKEKEKLEEKKEPSNKIKSHEDDELEKEEETKEEVKTLKEEKIEKDLDKKAEEWLLENYVTTSLSQREIGQKFNKERYEIANLVRKLGLKKKSQ